jgi:hypothetical protein
VLNKVALPCYGLMLYYFYLVEYILMYSPFLFVSLVSPIDAMVKEEFVEDDG